MLCPEVISSFWENKRGTGMLLASIDCLLYKWNCVDTAVGFQTEIRYGNNLACCNAVYAK